MYILNMEGPLSEVPLYVYVYTYTCRHTTLHVRSKWRRKRHVVSLLRCGISHHTCSQ